MRVQPQQSGGRSRKILSLRTIWAIYEVPGQHRLCSENLVSMPHPPKSFWKQKNHCSHSSFKTGKLHNNNLFGKSSASTVKCFWELVTLNSCSSPCFQWLSYTMSYWEKLPELPTQEQQVIFSQGSWLPRTLGPAKTQKVFILPGYNSCGLSFPSSGSPRDLWILPRVPSIGNGSSSQLCPTLACPALWGLGVSEVPAGSLTASLLALPPNSNLGSPESPLNSASLTWF